MLRPSEGESDGKHRAILGLNAGRYRGYRSHLRTIMIRWGVVISHAGKTWV